LKMKAKNIKKKKNLGNAVFGVVKSIKKKKKKKKQDTSSDSSSSDSSSSEDKKKSKNKNTKVSKESDSSSSEEKKKPKNKNTKQPKESDSSESEPEPPKKITQKPKPKKIEPDSSSESTLDANATEKSNTDNSSDEPPKKPIKKTVRFETSNQKENNRPAKVQKTSNKTLIVESDKKIEEKEPGSYNDYLVDFETEFGCALTNISEIKITNIKIPTCPEIDDSCNIFSINYNGEGYELELEGGKYTIDEILQDFNDSLQSIDSGILVSIKSNGKIMLEQENGEEFEFSCGKNSIGKYLGFTEGKYSGKSKYTSENIHNFLNKPIYMYIANISRDKPFAIINQDGKYEQKISSFETPISELSCLIIQFKNEISRNTDNLVNFNGIPHSITFTFKVNE